MLEKVKEICQSGEVGTMDWTGSLRSQVSQKRNYK